MPTIRVLLSAKLLNAADAAAASQKVDRSALIRRALEEYLAGLRGRDAEEQDRRGYLTQPQRRREWAGWDAIAAWPEE